MAAFTEDTSHDVSKSVFEDSIVSERFCAQSADGKKTVNVTPILVDFRRLIQAGLSNKQSIVPGIKNGDLLHAVAGLYDTTLTDLYPDTIYSTLCDKWARTIILLRDIKDTFLEFEKTRDKYLSVKLEEENGFPESPDAEASPEIPEANGITVVKDKYKATPSEDATFTCCYSDTDTEDEDADNDDDDDEEDFSVGINRFLKQVKQRRIRRLNHKGSYSIDHIGPENRIIGAATFDKKYVKSGEKIVHLTLTAVRRRFRRLGLGKFLVQKVKDPAISGPHEAVVVHAESDAKQFFTRYGFSDDVVLNNKWREIAEQFTQCTLMTYTPPYTGQNILGKVSDFDLLSLDQDLRKWKDKSIEAYQAQVTIIERMKAEMNRLRAMVTSQDEIIATLSAQIRTLESQKYTSDKKLAMTRMKMMSFNMSYDSDDQSFNRADDMASLEKQYKICSDNLPDIALASDTPSELLGSKPKLNSRGSEAVTASETYKHSELMRYVVVPKNSGEIYDHGKDIAEFHRICQDFKTSLREDPKIQYEYTVTSVSKALLNSSAVERYARTLRQGSGAAAVPLSVKKMYFCGSKENPERLKDILKNGFMPDDFTDGDYGKGLYFSLNASTAANFSTPHKILVSEVIIGEVQSLVNKEIDRRAPDDGFHSVKCPGRLLQTCGDESIVEEYVIYDCNQAMPLDLIEYTQSPTQSPSQSQTLSTLSC